MGGNNQYRTRNIVNEKRSKVVLSVSHLSFACVDLDSDKAIGFLKKVASNQTVTMKGKVVNLYGTEKVSGKNCSKQGMIADSSDTIKVVLWGSFIDLVEKGKTYHFINFSNKVDKYGIYIGSGRHGSSAKEVEGVEGPVAEFVDDEREIECTVLGISDATKCYSCRKVGAACIQWVVKLCVEEPTVGQQIVCFHKDLIQLISIVTNKLTKISIWLKSNKRQVNSVFLSMF